MIQGTIRRLMAQKRFGFIRAVDGTEYFFHSSGLEQTTKRWDDLREGDRVEFTGVKAAKGPRAIEIRVL